MDLKLDMDIAQAAWLAEGGTQESFNAAWSELIANDSLYNFDGAAEQDYFDLLLRQETVDTEGTAQDLYTGSPD